MRARVLVVGAGIAGCVLASRLAERFDVVVIEAGPWPEPPGDDDSDRMTMSPPWWSLSSTLTGERRWTARPGRGVGGSSVINGGYFAPPAPDDLRHWHAVGGDAWHPDRVAAFVDELGAELDARPAPRTHPIARAFAQASADAGRSDGILALQTTVRDGRARSAGSLLAAGIAAGTIEVRSNCRALRIVLDGDRAVGLEVADADGGRDVLAGEEIVIAAGGFGTPRLLLASGIGPADQLARAGITPVVDLPGVGAAFSDHPTVWVEFEPTPALAGRDAALDGRDGAFPVALSVGADGRAGDDLEILACVRPPAVDASDAARFGVIVGLQRPHSRGALEATSVHPLAAPAITYGYLADSEDAAALRVGVRLAASMLEASAFAGLVERVVEPDEPTLRDDRLLDAWIARRLGSAAHTCGSAPMGDAADPRAVVDGAGRVRGVDSLRIGDTSILPVVPSRAPASAAMATGAIVADQMM